MNNLTLGQYFPGNSPIHRLDPRTKIVLTLAYIVLIFLIAEPAGFLLCACAPAYGFLLHTGLSSLGALLTGTLIVKSAPLLLFLLPLIFVGVVIRISHVPASYVIKSLKPLRFILIVMFLINIFFTSVKTNPVVLFSIFTINIPYAGVLKGIYIVIRLVLLLGGTSLMTLTTSPVSLTDGMELLLAPLAKIKFPAHELAMMMTIALRFIPTLMEETDKIKKAQLARGADFESGSLIQRAKSMLPILVPLFVSAFRRADELAMAMESRCYHGGEGRTRLHVLRFSANDAVAAAVVVLLGAAIIIIQELIA